MTNGRGAEEHDVPPPPRARVDDAVGGADPAGSTTPAAAEPPEAEARAQEPVIFTGAAEGHDVPPPAGSRVEDALGGADPAQRAIEAARRRRGRLHLPEHERADRRSQLLRTSALMAGALVLATAFIAAYVGALHRPIPTDLPVAVVRGDAPAHTALNAIRARTDALQPIEYADAEAADDALHERSVYAVVASSGTTGLVVTAASAAGPPATQVIVQLVSAAAQQAGVRLTVVDAVPVAAEDPRGLIPFYLTVGLVLGGYLASTVLGLSLGTLPRKLHLAIARAGGLAVFSVLLGLAGALVVGPGIGVWHGHFIALAAVGALVVFAAAMAGAALQGWLGLAGTGLVILLVVVFGNPGSGGIYPPEFLPEIFRNMHQWNLPGLGSDLTKSVVYFRGKGINGPLTGLAIWVLAGLAALLAASAVLGRTRRR